MASLSGALSTKQNFVDINFWIVGDLITHAWSEKARREMLAKQVKATRAGKETRDPQTDFIRTAAEAHWEDQSRAIIRAVRVVDEEKPEQEPVRAFHSISRANTL